MVRVFSAPPVNPALLIENVELHRRGYFGGQTMLPYLPLIARLCQAHGSRSLLDFGSGKGELWEASARHPALRALEVQLYDPAVAAISVLPDRVFDGVICIDVLEHIPEDDLAQTLQAIAQRARQFVYLIVCPRAGTKVLPFSQVNVHVTVRPEAWWTALVQEHRAGIEWHLGFSL